MKRKLCFVVIGALLLCVTGTDANQRIKDAIKMLTPGTIARLEAGEVVVANQTYVDEQGNSQGQGVAIILINKPRSEVWRHMTDYSAWPQFMPKIEKANVYHQDGDKVGVEFTLKIWVKEITFSTRRTHNPLAGCVTWVMDRDRKSDIVDTQGAWLVKAHGSDKSILIYTVKVDSGLKVPKKVQEYLAGRDMPRALRAMKMRVETNGAYIKS